MLDETWRDQYERLQRSYELLKQVGEPTLMPQEVIPARDVLFHFCCDVFHLRDWIAADLGTDEASTKRVAQRINDDVIFPSPELSACCDVANGSKHLTLTQNSYVTREKQGHAELVSHGITLGVPAAAVVVPKAVAKGFLLRGTGPPVEDPVEVKEIESLPVPVPAVSSADNGFYQDSFTIDINGQPHDAQDVATSGLLTPPPRMSPARGPVHHDGGESGCSGGRKPKCCSGKLMLGPRKMRSSSNGISNLLTALTFWGRCDGQNEG